MNLVPLELHPSPLIISPTAPGPPLHCPHALPSSIGRSISTPLLICSLAYLTPVCQSPSAVSTLLWNRVPREQQVSKQTPAACLQRGCSGTRGPVCRVSRGWGSVMEERALHSNLHHLVTRLSLFLRSRDHTLPAAGGKMLKRPLSAPTEGLQILWGPAWARIPSVPAQSTRA